MHLWFPEPMPQLILDPPLRISIQHFYQKYCLPLRIPFKCCLLLPLYAFTSPTSALDNPCIKTNLEYLFFFLIEPNCRLLNGVTTGQPLFCKHCQFSPSEDLEYLWSIGILWRCIFLSGINWWKSLNTCWGMEVGGFNRTVFFRIL